MHVRVRDFSSTAHEDKGHFLHIGHPPSRWWLLWTFSSFARLALRLLATCNPRASRPTAFSRRHTSTQHIHRQSSAYFDVSVQLLRGCFNLFLHSVDENQISSAPAGILSAFRRGRIYGICVLHFFSLCVVSFRGDITKNTHTGFLRKKLVLTMS
jgi:hypothetical protein